MRRPTISKAPRKTDCSRRATAFECAMAPAFGQVLAKPSLRHYSRPASVSCFGCGFARCAPDASKGGAPCLRTLMILGCSGAVTFVVCAPRLKFAQGSLFHALLPCMATSILFTVGIT